MARGLSPSKILYVGDRTLLGKDASAGECAYTFDDYTPWFEVPPPAPEQAKTVRLGFNLSDTNIFGKDSRIMGQFLSTKNPALPIVIELDVPLTECMDGRYEIRGKLFVEVPVKGEGI